MSNYYQYRNGLPYHLSVGAVIINDQNEVLCHHFDSFILDSKEYRDFYILMRETLELGESLETALYRGCQEEMGAEIEILDYLGPIIANYDEVGYDVEKTTLYFRCRLISQHDGKRTKGDPEESSQISWQPIEDLIKSMEEQGKRLGREDLDESAVLKRLA